MAKNYLVITGKKDITLTYCALRRVCEQIAGLLGYTIDSHGVNYKGGKYKDGRDKILRRSYLYKGERQSRFDEIPFETIEFAMFCSCFAQKRAMGSQPFIAANFHEKGCALSAVWPDDRQGAARFEQTVRAIRALVEKIISPSCLFAGRMEDKKGAEYFAMGWVVDSRSDLENRVACNISQARFGDERLPFLFPYTIATEGTFSKTELQFCRPDLLDEPADRYTQDPEWRACYWKWLEEGIIAPLKKPTGSFGLACSDL